MGIVVFEAVDHAAIGERGGGRRESIARSEDARGAAAAVQRGSGLEIRRAGAGRRRREPDTDRIEQMQFGGVSHIRRNRGRRQRSQPGDELLRQRHAAASWLISRAAASPARRPRPTALRRPLPEA